MSQNMNRNRRYSEKESYERTRSTVNGKSRQAYVYGSAARQPKPAGRRRTASAREAEYVRQQGAEPARRRQSVPTREMEHAHQERIRVRRRRAVSAEQMEPVVRKNRDKARYMNAGYVFFLAVAMCAATLILVNYVQLQAELTNRIRSVAAKKSELNSIRTANDEEYNRIINSVNLEEIRRIAIGELGMTYAQEGQIIHYTNENSDYMRPVLGDN